MMKSGDKQTARPLIIGYGNLLRGDDALGHVIVAHLQTQLDTGLVRIIYCQQLTLDLAEDLAEASRVILIDASVCGIPGTLSVQPVMPSCDAAHTLEHHVTPIALVTAVSVLYKTVPPVMMISVVGQEWDAGATLSAAVRSRVPDVIATVIRLLGGER